MTVLKRRASAPAMVAVGMLLGDSGVRFTNNIPVSWLDALFMLGCELPTEEGQERVVSGFTRGLSGILTDVSVAVRFVDDEEIPSVYYSGQSMVPDPGSGRLFPKLQVELAFETSVPDVTMHLATDSPERLKEGGPQWQLASRAALLLGRLIASTIAKRNGRREALALKAVTRELAQAEKLASFGQLTAGIVHELGSPLSAIVAYVDLLERRIEEAGWGDDDKEKLLRIRDSAGRLLRFSRDLLSFARPSDEPMVPVCIEDLVSRAVALTSHEVETARATLHVDVTPALSHVRGRADQLLQVLLNLVTNACHAVRDGGDGGEIRIVAEPAPEDPGYVQIVVEDSGHGISDHDLPRVFDAFYTTKSRESGTGLGLSVVKGIILEHDGRIEAQRGNRGARFVVALPVARE
ncbi:MAG: HAMP domain-containing sensor histidine kinase [Polyangiaceae bacterium]